MSITTEWLSTIASIVSALATSIAAGGVIFAYRQISITREIAQVQFEDGLAREYRQLAASLPSITLLGSELTEDQYSESFDKFFHYIDLSNEQIGLREQGRISDSVWVNWRDGIKYNLSLPAFARAWSEIRQKSESFAGLRALEGSSFLQDPKN